MVTIIGAIVLNFTRAKYRTSESIPLVTGTINYELSDFNLIGVYIEDGDDYTKVDQIPDSGYTLNEEKSYCKIGDKEQDMTITYDMNTKTLNITPITKEGTKCYLYFDKSKAFKDIILANSKINEGEPDFSQVATTDEGLYKTQDDRGESYYFRGAVNNNWVKFAGYYWRIIRINGDGSVRLIYQGIKPTNQDSTTQITKSYYNSNYYDNEDVGFMYTYGQVHGLTNSSTIKEKLDNWYVTNLASYASKLEINVGFCNDRSIYSGTGLGSNSTYYNAYKRLEQNKNPSLKCEDNRDLFSVKESNIGNQALDNPIGLITADEIAMAGGGYNIINKNYYLYTNQYYWTMTPYGFPEDAAVLFVTANGSLDYYYAGDTMGNSLGVRPVINLSSKVTITGSGTSEDPYSIM